MIKYEDGEFLDLLPSLFKEKEDVVAISYAFRMAVASLLQSQTFTYLFADINDMPEELLDLMALEMKAPYYDEDLEIEVKRELVKNAMLWRSQAGTKKSVEDLIRTLFGAGEVIEWYDFEGEPGTPGEFDIITSAPLTPELFSKFTQIIDQVKNESSHLRRIQTAREIDGDFYAGTVVTASQRCVITQLISAQVDINQIAYGAVGHSDAPRVIIT